MTLHDRIRRIRWCLDSIEAKAGSHDPSPIECAIADTAKIAEDLHAIGVELGARKAKVAR